MRLKRVTLNIFACISGYILAGLFISLLVQLFLSKDGSVELDYIRPLVMDQVDDYSSAVDMERRVKILCWTFVDDRNKSDEMRNKFEHIAATWGQKCTTMLFLSEEKLNLMVDDKSKNNVIRVLKYLQNRVDMEHYDWVMKFDANVYIVMENLRQFLLPYTTTLNSLVHATLAENSSPQNSILILNKPAIDRLIATNDVACQNKNYPHDMDNCLSVNNISSIKFNYVSNYVDILMTRGNIKTLKIFKELKYCCQHMSIYFYNIKPYELYVYEYFLYNVRAVGQVPVYNDGDQR